MSVQTAEQAQVQEAVEPAVATEFKQILMDMGYETLRQELEKLQAGAPVVSLLDDLMVLACEPREVSWATNQVLLETLGHLTHAIMEVGGRITVNGKVYVR